MYGSVGWVVFLGLVCTKEFLFCVKRKNLGKLILEEIKDTKMCRIMTALKA